jgi:exosortase/archaeosortase family protein
MELPKDEVSNNSKVPKDDIGLDEFIEIGKRYLIIPLGLLFVEIIYSILTSSQDTLAWIQEIVAKFWNKSNHMIYGKESSTLSEYGDSGLMTKIELYNPNFPDIQNNTIDFYVSDECAGVHEMLFITTLILLTPYISKKIKTWSIPIILVIVFCLNLLRLVLIYPLAASGCEKNPGVWGCDVRWEIFHDFVFEWGSLIILTIMWLIWFYIVNSAFFNNMFGENSSEE